MLHKVLTFIIGIFIFSNLNAQINDTWHSNTLLYSRANNLMSNGSFESGPSTAFTHMLFRCGTRVPNNWTSIAAYAEAINNTDRNSSSSIYYSYFYGTWGPRQSYGNGGFPPNNTNSCEGQTLHTYGPSVPHGSQYVYMGNGAYVRNLPAPNWNDNKGTIFPNGTNLSDASSTNSDNMSGNRKAFDMTHSAIPVSQNTKYGIEIWAGPEDLTIFGSPEGFFEVRIGFYNASDVQIGSVKRIYHPLPDGTGSRTHCNLGNAERFYTEFTTPSGTAKVLYSVVNWGHVDHSGLFNNYNPNWASWFAPLNNGGKGTTQEVIIDDIVMSRLLNVSGQVFVDANGNGVKSGSAEVGIDPNNLSAVLTNSAGVIIQIVPVNSNGTYTFTSAPANMSNLEVSIVPTSALNSTRRGAAANQQTEPIGTGSWYYTGTNKNGSSVYQTTGRSELPEITFNTSTSNISGLNFGINQPPTANSKTSTQTNNVPIGNTRYPLTYFGSNLTLTGNDNQDGSLGSGNTMVITTIPNASTEGRLYYNGVLVTAGQVISNYNPALLTFDPADRSLPSFPVDFTYQTRDAAGELSTPATISFTVSTKVSISGIVFLDRNADALGVSGNGIEPVPMYAVLTDANNKVIQTVPVNSNGSYTFTSAPAGTSNLHIYISTQNPGVNSTFTASDYPLGWTPTGVNISDASPNTSASSFTVSTTNTNKSSYNFGIRETISMGNSVWNDMNKNGIMDPGETGIEGATVYLYADANQDGIPDGVALQTVTTGTSGQYLFTGLTEGNYVMGIVPPSSANGNYISSVSGEEINPNLDVDNNDNGISTVGNETFTGSITLMPGTEPLGENPDNDPNSLDGNENLTIDFGFFLCPNEFPFVETPICPNTTIDLTAYEPVDYTGGVWSSNGTPLTNTNVGDGSYVYTYSHGGCTVTDTLIVDERVPDYAPTISIAPNSIVGTQNIRTIVTLTELNDKTSCAPVYITIPRQEPRFTFSYEPNASVIGGISVMNSEWQYISSHPILHVWQYIGTGGTFPASGIRKFGFIGPYNPQNTDGVSTFSVQVYQGSGGETNQTNNTDSEDLIYHR